MKPRKMFFSPFKRAADADRGTIWSANLAESTDVPVLLIPLDGPEHGQLQPREALEILVREQHPCTGDGCGHCASVRVLAAALFPLNESAAA